LLHVLKYLRDRMLVVSDSEDDTRELGSLLAGTLGPGDVVAVYGQLGSGKTVFCQGLAAGLGVKDRVTSPTYTLISEYVGRVPFFHFDVYRLESSDEMYDLGFDEYFYGCGVTAIEWADRIEELLPAGHLRVRIDRDADADRRQVEIIDSKTDGHSIRSLVDRLGG